MSGIIGNVNDLMKSGREESGDAAAELSPINAPKILKNKVIFKTLIGSLNKLEAQEDKHGKVIDPPLEWDPDKIPVLKNLSLHYWWVTDKHPDAQTPHREDEIYLILNGRGHFSMGLTEKDATTTPIRPGDLIYVPRSVWHRFKALDNDPLGLHILIFFGPDYSGASSLE